ncbi:mitotic spindle assembly checkpoint protein MAD2A-like isoform X2 [Paramacrobiotus metropolitanus]|nr:mitotic spindle assembly checkpoint protein MAD2A-like isoform X2 [Paramacrobiotus metropolitanus]
MRGVYPTEMFESVPKYGMSIFDAKDEELKSYLEKVMKWTKDWMMEESVTAIVLVIINPITKDIVERWQFKIMCDQQHAEEKTEKSVSGAKPAPTMEEIRRQIGSVLKQIVASVSILPATPLDAMNTFNILVYTKDNLDVPADWQESNPHFIRNAQQLHFRKIHTSVHEVDTCVTYRSE